MCDVNVIDDFETVDPGIFPELTEEQIEEMLAAMAADDFIDIEDLVLLTDEQLEAKQAEFLATDEGIFNE